MKLNKYLQRIEDLRIDKGWTLYKLADMACITQSTLTNAKSRNTIPSIATIVSVCEAFEITLAQFFTTSDELTTVLSRDEQAIVQDFRILEDIDRKMIKDLIKGLKTKNRK